MAKIRKANFFDKSKLKKMISFLGADAINQYTKGVIISPLNVINDLVPLRFKFLSESYVIEEDKELLGMVTVLPVKGNPFRLVISRLFLNQDYFNTGKQLLDYIIAKYGAKGVTTFVAAIDDSYNEVLNLFVNGCGFRQCSSEQLWKMENIRVSQTDNTFFRPFKNSDAQSVAMLFNDSIITHFKCSISRNKQEYLDSFFRGLSDYKFRYIVEDKNLKTVKAYFSITTADDINYILDITTSPWYELSLEDILDFTVRQVSKRNKDFCLFVKLKKYTTTAETIENFLLKKEAKCIQNQLILTKDFYKIIKEPQLESKIVFFNDVNEKPVFKV